jgi:hypothetical protein
MKFLRSFLGRFWIKRRCCAVTDASGLQCTRETRVLGRYCWQHLPKVPFIVSALLGFGLKEIYHTIIPTAEARQIEATRHEIEKVTGSGSYCYLVPLCDESTGWVTLMLNHEGVNPLTNIDFVLINHTKLRQLPFKDLLPKFPVSPDDWAKFRRERDLEGEFERLREQAISRYHIPRSQKQVGLMLTRFLIPDSLAEQDLGVTIYSSSGVLNQRILLRKVGAKWKVSFRVYRIDDAGQRKTISEVVDHEVHLSEE